MILVRIELDKLKKWQSALDKIDGAFSISEEMYDFIARNEQELERQQEIIEQKDAVKVKSMKEIMIGDEYRISKDVTFRGNANVLRGAVVKVEEKKRTRVGVRCMSTIPGYTGQTFRVNFDVLEKI